MAHHVQVCNTSFYLNKFLKPLLLDLKSRGHEVTAICAKGEVDKSLIEAGIKVRHFEFPHKASALDFILKIIQFYRILRDIRPDVVNSHNRNASIVARVACFFVPDCKNIYTAHGFYFHDDQSNFSRWASKVLEAVLDRMTDFGMSQSIEDINVMTREGWIDQKKWAHIGNGIDTKKFYRKIIPNDRKSLFTIAAVGRLVRGKGFEDLLKAFAIFHSKHPQSRLLIIGGNINEDIQPTGQNLLGMIKELKIENSVHITGIVHNVQDYLAQADVFVHPSYREGLPRSLLEAMCSGLICMATEIRGAREIILHNKNGILFKPKNPVQLSELLEQCFHKSPEEMYSLRQSAQDLVLQSYDEKNYVKKQSDLLERFTKDEKSHIAA